MIIIIFTQEVKGLTENLYTCALDWPKTYLHAEFQVRWCYMVSGFRVFKKDEEHEDDESCFPVFHTSCDISSHFCLLLLFHTFSTFMSLDDSLN